MRGEMMNRRPTTLFALLILLAIAFFMANIGAGEYELSLWEVVQTLFGLGSGEHSFIVNTLRLPRALIAFLVGAGLAVSGAILQGITSNPLASPGVIGLNAGASLAAVLVIVALPAVPLGFLPPAAFAGALLAAILTYWLGWKEGSSMYRIILVGVGVSAIAQAFITIIMMSGKIMLVTQALIWMTGSVYGRGWEHFYALLPWMILFLPLAFLLSRQLNLLQLGDDVSKGLGSKIEWVRGGLILVSVALAAASVATAGTVYFVGLMAPHIARRLFGPSHTTLLPASALTGGLLVLASDFVGRTIAAPVELPCGLITAMIGAPYFIYLLLTENKKSGKM
ncbi:MULTISPECIES: FecCD family ABC transporter permease [Brevibacillus]|jgi:iron complex transport system permease protein|uniref:Transport system permease n=2 Tax=Brevibacillus borstelensis TaxID=45462 RepID=M8D8L9_9BACL|nr:iron ABC transporter permease [Brevibacillus borstelensis]EMT52594.1 transport system permease [Brevibacillus borstelensis AK1]KKX55122.1 iron ABC transporter permease [Brevibacillus borstelensis cifa_chp40]MBE5396914.1 iron ABC transporter permease [Brevibacillus borstelensis]MCC0563843.1 iron ABC transporter permease [Brevibacillus borstelensis]MCM3472038.1 iron ABC transporter permease [Brevibacillus borstelensis]